ncbi:hypothetical protein BGX38DRAFT_1140661 [Terfezia claveryi]|nr:hypothetical protein BGX38DRAFT_1140661 [Terfezia claveryi]
MSNAGTGIGIRTSPVSQTSTINSSQTKITSSGPERRRHKQILKCTQCRLDKQRCTPVERVWPNRCDRCVKYNHSCSPGLNAREERRRQAPSSFPLSFRTPPSHSESKGRSGTLSPAPGSQYGANAAYRIRVPSPGTASSTGGSDDDQGDYAGEYNRVSIQGGNRGGISGYQSDGAPRVGQPQHLTGLPISIMDGHMGASNCNDRGLTDSNHDVTRYLNCLMESSCDLPSPSISDPTTPIYSMQAGSHPSGYSNYSYFPLDARQDHPPSRPRSPTSRTLHTRFTQFWAHLNPFGMMCPESPKFVSTVHTIFTHYVPLYAELDDMVNHALMAFSAADAGINAGGEWGRKLNIAGWKHAGRCQRMLGVRLGKLRLQREVTDALVVDSEITAVRLGILLMLFYGLFIGDASLLRLTSQLLTLYRIIPTHTLSSNINAPTAIPIVSHYTELHNGGYRVHLTLDNSHEDEEIGLIVDHGTQVFAQIRSQYESHIAPEILWGAALHEDDDDDEGEEEEDEEQDENASGMGVGGLIRKEDSQRTARRTKQKSELLDLSTNMGTAHSGILITPNSATALTPNIDVANFTEFGSAPFPPSTGAYRELVPVPESQSHAQSFSQPHAQLHHLPHFTGEAPSSAAPPFIVETTGYPRAPPHMNSAATGDIPPTIPLTSQIPTDGAESSLRHMQRHMHQNMDL